MSPDPGYDTALQAAKTIFFHREQENLLDSVLD